MSWRRVAVIYATLLMLTGFLMVFEREQPVTGTVDARSPSSSLLATDAASVTSATFRKEGKTVHATRLDQRWRTVEPEAAAVSPDLIEATIATLTAGQVSETLDEDPDAVLAAYGLDVPTATVEVVIAKDQEHPITVLIGAHNPTRTAVYARRSDQNSVFLVGMNLSYYIDLIIDAADS